VTLLKLKIKINDAVRAVEVLEDSPSRIIVKIRGRSYKCQIEDYEEDKTCSAPERTIEPVPAADVCITESPPYRMAAEETGAQVCIIEVRSPLPGVISSIERKVGSKVNKGDVVLYLEAMKMLNDIVAPRAGVIESFEKSPGQIVNVDDLLFKIRSTGE